MKTKIRLRVSLLGVFFIATAVMAGEGAGATGGTGFTNKDATEEYMTTFSEEKILECRNLVSAKAKEIIGKLKAETVQTCPSQLEYRIGALFYRNEKTSFYDVNDMPRGRETYTTYTCRVMVTSICNHLP